MDIPDTVIITIETADKKINVDMELPANIPIYELQFKLLEALKNSRDYKNIFSNWRECFIICENMILKDNDTLAGKGIFDGKFLKIIKT